MHSICSNVFEYQWGRLNRTNNEQDLQQTSEDVLLVPDSVRLQRRIRCRDRNRRVQIPKTRSRNQRVGLEKEGSKPIGIASLSGAEVFGSGFEGGLGRSSEDVGDPFFARVTLAQATNGRGMKEVRP